MTPDRILVIDDEELAFHFAQDVLQTIRPGFYQVEWASTYDAGLTALTTGSFDLCILDQGLGARSGIDLLREIAARGVATPVIMLTGQKSSEMDMEAMRAGAADYLVKGDIPAALLERTVRYTLAQTRARAQLRESVDALRRSEERFAMAFRMAPLGIMITSMTDGRVLEANDRLQNILGYAREEIVGRTSLEAGIWADPAERAEAAEITLRDGSINGFVARLRTKSGADRMIELYSQVLDVEGEPCALTLMHDITERRALEEELRRAQKMEAVGRLAGGIAHDFNNVLTGILGNTDFLLREIDPGSPLHADVEGIQQGAERARDLTRQLLAFSSRQVVRPRTVDLSRALAGLEDLVQRLVGDSVEVTVAVAPDTGCVRADPGQLEQIVMNLTVNARDAMPDGGNLSVRLHAVAVDGLHLSRLEEAPPEGTYVVLEVRDTGRGIPPDIQEHLFEPFFTTKEQGEGVGLGLATVYAITKQNGGFIEVDSVPGAGTTFRVYLPQVEPRSGRHGTTASTPDRSGNETILVVEDEDTVRVLVRRILRQQGYRVLEAPGPAEVLSRILPEYGNEIDLVITDVVMPKMNGRELAERVLAVRPDMDIIYMSGYTEDEIVRRGIVHMSRRFLEKPFTPAQLSALVRDVLDGQA